MRGFKLITLVGALLALCSTEVRAQEIALKTNLLFGGLTLTPNLGAEVKLDHQSTLDFGAGYQAWNKDGQPGNNKKLVNLTGQVEYRYWLCEAFNGHFFGGHVVGSEYNISKHNLPLLFGQGSEQFRYEGWAAGVGFSYGYQFILSNRWSLELNVGVGYAYLNYDKYEHPRCGDLLEVGSTRHYFGPTKAGISIMFLIK